MQFVADDPVNRSIWTESVSLQRKIVGREKRPLQVGAQQAMPKACDEGAFSPQRPLPWVPDLCGCRFGENGRGVLVVGSSYNGFIEGYSNRTAVMPLHDYVNAKNDEQNGLQRFCRSFVENVVKGDEDYYQPILRDLLEAAGCPAEDCCLTDLCKASFVQRGSGADTGNRGDKGNDSVLKMHWRQWTRYMTVLPHGGGEAPLPCQWLWQRMQQCRVIVALGSIAEYGVLKIFRSMTTGSKVFARAEDSVTPDHAMLVSPRSGWEYGYASSRRKLRDWIPTEDWWVLADSSGKPRWFLLPVYHPSAAIGHALDIEYRKTAPRVRTLVREAAVIGGRLRPV